MATYAISGIWKNTDGTITHYAFHTKLMSIHTPDNNVYSRAEKVAKDEAITRVSQAGNTTRTWTWDYIQMKWLSGAIIDVINDKDGTYLRSRGDDKLRDNLAHLVDYNFIFLL